AAPANTISDMSCACIADKPIWIANAPVKIPHGITAMANGIVSNAASRLRLAEPCSVRPEFIN
ncbi:MAG: hypothetical protein ACI9FR_002901, partial [Cryomorphaceae bacterium]